MKITQVDTTAPAIFARCDKAMASTKSTSWHSATSMRAAAITFFLDVCGITGADRGAVAKIALATPGWFLAGNGSQAQQARAKKGEVKAMADYVENL